MENIEKAKLFLAKLGYNLEIIDKYPFEDIFNNLWPVCRSISGPGLRNSLNILRRQIPDLKINEVSSGSRAFDWEIPQEWDVKEAYIEDSQGARILDFQNNNLHVVNYSVSIDKLVTLDELEGHIFYLKDRPNAIPYVTSYYNKTWGFCVSYNFFQSLKRDDNYRVVIKASHIDGSMSYGDCVLHGKSDREIFFSSYLCHPSMANNELSGPLVLSALVKTLSASSRYRYSYRFYIGPETIGAIHYLSLHKKKLVEDVDHGFMLTCVGDENSWSFLPTRTGGRLTDKVAKHVLQHLVGDYKVYDWLKRGSDERQYCWPGIDLPVVSVMRSKYAEYPEYHTSDDKWGLVTSRGLKESSLIHLLIVAVIEINQIYESSVLCEPRLGKRNLYDSIYSVDGRPVGAHSGRFLVDILSYADGINSLLEISELIGAPIWIVYDAVTLLMKEGLMKKQ